MDLVTRRSARKRSSPTTRDAVPSDGPVAKRRRTARAENAPNVVHRLAPVQKKIAEMRGGMKRTRASQHGNALLVKTTPSSMREMSIDAWGIINLFLGAREIANLRCTGDKMVSVAVSRFTKIVHLLNHGHPRTNNHLHPIMTLVGVQNPEAPCFQFIRELVVSQPFHAIFCHRCGGAACNAHCKFSLDATFPVLESLYVDDNVIRDWAAASSDFGIASGNPTFPVLKTMVVLLHTKKSGDSYISSRYSDEWQTWMDVFYQLQFPPTLEHLEFKTSGFEKVSVQHVIMAGPWFDLCQRHPHLEGRHHETYAACTWDLFSHMPNGLKRLLMPCFDVPLKALTNLPPQLIELRTGSIDGSPNKNKCACSLHDNAPVDLTNILPKTLRRIANVPIAYGSSQLYASSVSRVLETSTESIGCLLVNESIEDQRT